MGKLENRINRIFELFGVEIKRTRSCPSLQTLLRRFFQQYNVDCVFDVGANTGGYAEFLRDEVRYKGLIISFEPVTEVFQTLAQKAEHDSKWVPLQYALGTEERVDTIHVTAEKTFCSFLTPAHEAVSQYKDQNKVEAEEKVHIHRLDQVFEGLKTKYGFQRPFLKMDTQGYDREVLLGGKSVLSQFIGCQSEMSLLPLYEKMPRIAEMLPLTTSLGFDFIGTFAVNKDSAGRWIEGDCVFVQRKAIQV